MEKLKPKKCMGQYKVGVEYYCNGSTEMHSILTFDLFLLQVEAIIGKSDEATLNFEKVRRSAVCIDPVIHDFDMPTTSCFMNFTGSIH